MLQRFQQSIRAKLMGAFLVPIVAVAAFALVFHPLQQRDQSLDVAHDEVTLLSEMLAFSVGAGFSADAYDLVQTAYEWAKDNPNVVFIAILDEAGEPIMEHNPGEIEVDVAAALAKEGAQRKDSHLLASAPVLAGEDDYGDVVLVYTLEHFAKDLQANILISVLATLLLLGGGIVLVLWLSGRIARRIVRLRNSARAVGEGDLDAVIEVDVADEIGDLAASFGQMVEEIRWGQEALQAEKSAVEQKVEEAVRASEEEKRYLAQSVDRMLGAMDRFAEGDLTVHLTAERNDEIGKLYSGFNRAIDTVRVMLVQVAETLDQTSAASMQISTSAEMLAAGAQAQSDQALEVASAVEEMACTVTDNAQTATRTAEVAASNGQVAEEGGQIVMQTVDKIRDIADVVRGSAETIERLGTSSQEVGAIVSVIDEIAEQTNLLALNAAIEAARAGEQGRGFAVVADEVRKLSERTTDATKQIAEMIKTIQAETKAAVAAMTRGNAEVAQGIELADRAQEALQAIVANVGEVVGMVTQIAAASEEQSTTSGEMAHGVESIATVSREAAEGISQIAHSASNLEQMMNGLRNSVARFQLGEATSAAALGNF